MKKHKGFGMIDIIGAIFLISIAAVSFISFRSSLGQKNSDIETYTAMQVLATSLAEQMHSDIKKGVILTMHDYSIDPEKNILSADVMIDEALLYGEYLYLVTADIRSENNLRVVTHFCLRGDDT